MKKLLFVLVLCFGLIGVSNAKTVVSINRIHAFTVDENGTLPVSVSYDPSGAPITPDQVSTCSWSLE